MKKENGRYTKSYRDLAALVKDEGLAKLTAELDFYKEEVGNKVRTVCFYTAEKVGAPSACYIEVTNTNIEWIEGPNGEPSQDVGYLERLLLTDLRTISLNLESVPDSIEKVLLCRGSEFDIDSQLYGSQLDGSSECIERAED